MGCKLGICWSPNFCACEVGWEELGRVGKKQIVKFALDYPVV